jgi:L-fuconolactonase
MTTPGTQAWLDLVTEDVVEPDAADRRPAPPPVARGWCVALRASPSSRPTSGAGTASRRRCSSSAAPPTATDGPDHLASGGRDRVRRAQAAMTSRPLIAGIVGRADLRLGDRLDDVLDAHVEAGAGLFRGIRHALARAEHPDVLRIPGRAPGRSVADPAFRAGRRPARRARLHLRHVALPLPAARVARARPGGARHGASCSTTSARRSGWAPTRSARGDLRAVALDIAELARCDNVVVKLGGLAMPDNGFGWDAAERPPTSDEVVAAHAPWYYTT